MLHAASMCHRSRLPPLQKKKGISLLCSGYLRDTHVESLWNSDNQNKNKIYSILASSWVNLALAKNLGFFRHQRLNPTRKNKRKLFYSILLTHSQENGVENSIITVWSSSPKTIKYTESDKGSIMLCFLTPIKIWYIELSPSNVTSCADY